MWRRPHLPASVTDDPLPSPSFPSPEPEQVEFDTVETDRGVQASNVTGVGGVPLDRTRMDYGEEEEH